MSQLTATTSDNMFTLAAKQLKALGGTVSAGDTLFTLQAKITQAQGTGTTGGGGIPEAPTDGQPYARQSQGWVVGVQNPSAAQVVVKGDQFTQDTNPTPTPAFMMENAAGGAGIGIAVGSYGDSITFVKANGSQANIRSQGTIIMGAGSPNVQIMPGGVYPTSASGAQHASITAQDDGSLQFTSNGGIELNDNTRLGSIHWNTSGDLIITQITGPNAGKSVNLTSGKWA